MSSALPSRIRYAFAVLVAIAVAKIAFSFLAARREGPRADKAIRELQEVGRAKERSSDRVADPWWTDSDDSPVATAREGAGWENIERGPSGQPRQRRGSSSGPGRPPARRGHGSPSPATAAAGPDGAGFFQGHRRGRVKPTVLSAQAVDMPFFEHPSASRLNEGDREEMTLPDGRTWTFDGRRWVESASGGSGR